MPFPRRPQFQISDINLNGLLAYVATNSIIFIEIENESPSFRDSPSEDMHKDEVTAISFCREKGYYHLLATASRDKTVKIWDTTDISKGKLLCKQTLCWKAEIVSIDWQLKKNKDTLYVLDNKGVLIVWRLENDSHFIVNTVVSSRAILLSASPYNRFLVALGYQGGLIHIFHSMRNGIGKILEGHVEDIISLSWPPHFPSSDNVTKDWSDTLDIASTSKDGTIRVWNIETQRCLVLEKPPSCKVSNSKDDYIIACWNPRSLREIFCSSSNGELYLLDARGVGFLSEWKKFDTTSNGKHSDYIYCVSAFNRTICTFCNDQMIFIWNSTKLSSVLGIPAVTELVVQAEDIETPRSEPDILDHQRPELFCANSAEPEFLCQGKYQNHSNSCGTSNRRESRFISNPWQVSEEKISQSSWPDSKEKQPRTSWQDSKEKQPRTSWQDSKEKQPRTSWQDSKEKQPRTSWQDSKEKQPRTSWQDSKEKQPRTSWQDSKEKQPRTSWQDSKEKQPRTSWQDSKEKQPRTSWQDSKEKQPRTSWQDSKEKQPRTSWQDSKEKQPRTSSQDSKEKQPRTSSQDSKEKKPCTSSQNSSWNKKVLNEEEYDWGEAVKSETPINGLDISWGENLKDEADEDNLWNSAPTKQPSVKEDFEHKSLKQTQSTPRENFYFEVPGGKNAQTTTLNNLPDLLDLRPSSRSSCHYQSNKLENQEKCQTSSDCELSLEEAKFSSDRKLSENEVVAVKNIQKFQTSSDCELSPKGAKSSSDVQLSEKKTVDLENVQKFKTGSESKVINLTPNKSGETNNVQKRQKNLKKESSPTKALIIVNDPILLLKLSCRKSAEQKLVEATLGVASQCVWKAMEARRWEVVDGLVEEQRELNVIEESKLNALMLLSYLHKMMMEFFDNDYELPIANEPLIVYHKTADIWISRKFDGKNFLKSVSEQWETMLPNLTDVCDVMYTTIKKLYSQSNKNCFITDEFFCTFAVDLSLSLLSNCENTKFIHVNSVFVTAYHSQETHPTLNQICRLLGPNLLALVKDENFKDQECSLAKIAKLARSESGPGAACCAFFMFNLLNQLHCEITNVNVPLMDHSHFVFNAKPLQSIVYETKCDYFTSKVESLINIILEGMVIEGISSQKVDNPELGIYPVRSHSLEAIQRVLRVLKNKLSCFSAKSGIMQIESKIPKY